MSNLRRSCSQLTTLVLDVSALSERYLYELVVVDNVLCLKVSRKGTLLIVR